MELLWIDFHKNFEKVSTMVQGIEDWFLVFDHHLHPKIFKGFLSLHALVILDMLGFGGGMQFLSALVSNNISSKIFDFESETLC